MSVRTSRVSRETGSCGTGARARPSSLARGHAHATRMAINSSPPQNEQLRVPFGAVDFELWVSSAIFIPWTRAVRAHWWFGGSE